ncbi:DNA starvation/stationary phase protection protein [Candidatus Peregrinibacteria bacterium]|nr:MAG: DNA starvation/stationary phase protection protein [Candidatus Peregrinibacteria bacterium]
MNTILLLKKALADTAALYSKTHSFHWNITGPRFQELHIFFETLYTTLWNEIDQIAEQIRIQGEMAPHGYGEMIASATIQEENTIPDAEKMLGILTSDLEKLLASLKAVVKSAQNEENDTLEGFLLTLMEGHEKTLWMMKSMKGA